MLLKILAWPRNLKRIVAATADVLGISLALWFAVSVESRQLYMTYDIKAGLFVMSLAGISVLLFYRLGLYRAVTRHIGIRALFSVVLGVLASTLMLILFDMAFETSANLTVIVIYSLSAFIFIGASRFGVRSVFRQIQARPKANVIIYGAGEAGRQLAHALMHGNDYHPIAFVDDDQTLHGALIQHLTVYPQTKIAELVKEHNVERILLAFPSAGRSVRRSVIDQLSHLPVTVQTIPGMADIVSGEARIDELREVNIEDLLGRDAVAPDTKLLNKNIKDKVVMVTGAGGSIGSELCRQVALQKPKALILFEWSEPALYYIDQELREQSPEVAIYPFVGSVQDETTLRSVLNTHRVDTIYHAAAYKHVPMVEMNIVQAVKNNVLGTLCTAEAAIEAGVEKFVLVSTDKAVRPTNVMGATKRMAELVLQGLAQHASTTAFCMVRFGNVLGSSGSVVPKFREQIKQGGPITLTHKDITRYFMTIPEAAQLVIQAGAMGNKGDVFVLDMGEPIKIYDLAQQMIRLSGLTPKSEAFPDGDIEIAITGLRPGEKLYEELIIGDNDQNTQHPRIRRASEWAADWSEVGLILRDIRRCCAAMDGQGLRRVLEGAPTSYTPNSRCVDLHRPHHVKLQLQKKLAF
ncbi:FlaA1/EpsC-like NDP-sugar epimerase [Idiomarina fontislapidosi]|uniref:Nucleoside-diphosphate sugar epimerase n=1 Tax=Idiomarina fontislapidosi TaxID=263723 RepID=A0A432YAZ3_9GAMM|nr:nucleoside-diphosphate sugar epimerase/dehydratase [Idiomarina fontislapidosi]PYE35213.1 FlaA1/EpsC-like NDP-sugar epimerase [Idiomarina fontislapidosi]RUO58107.1 nucleoside-diphosphate sugar epimerase [Idiomarina fontislapidosi]